MTALDKAVSVLSGTAPADVPIISVLVGRQYAVERARCIPLADYVLQEELVYYPEIQQPGRIRPSLLKRDIDVYSWRRYTDLVIQGTARSDTALPAMSIQLTCTGKQTRLEHELIATGDRLVERDRYSKLRLSEPQPFTEMPIRYDKAYGGTDERAEAKLANLDEIELLRSICGEDEDRESSEYSYPRNPAGKGYLIDLDGAEGLCWPNLEFPSERLTLDRLAAPLALWGDRPYPACFDWQPHAFFPRVAFFGDFPETQDGRPPAREVTLGILEANLETRPLIERPKHGFAQGAHPYLARNRLHGDETIRVSAMSRDGRDFEVSLPDERPKISLHLPLLSDDPLPAELDLCFIETEEERLTLLWRMSAPLKQEELPPEWEKQTTLTIAWQGRTP